MLSRFLKRGRARAEEPKPAISVPEGVRTYAIGDVHGRLDLLDALLERIDEDDAQRPDSSVQLVFVGDLIDRGPDSAGVMRRVLQLEDHGDVRIIMGNHEEIWLRYLDGETTLLPSFTKMGGLETILSYGITREEFDSLPADALLNRVRDCVPASHIAALRRFEDTVAIGGYVFVHAGIRPGFSFPEQKTDDLRWIREPFLSDDSWHGAMVIHGHSVTATAEERPNRIGIDTGAFISGRLTAIGLEGTDRWFVTAEGAQGSPRYASRRTVKLFTAEAND